MPYPGDRGQRILSRQTRVLPYRKGLSVDSRRCAEVPSRPPMSAASVLPLFHVVGFSGHRQLADPAEAAKVIRSVLDDLRRKAPGEWIALSSVAIGSDQI